MKTTLKNGLFLFGFFSLLFPSLSITQETIQDSSVEEEPYFQIGGALKPDTRVILDITKESLFYATCEMNEQCLLTAPYVRIQNRADYLEASREFVETRNQVEETLISTCATVGCQMFLRGKYLERLLLKEWTPDWKPTCTQLILSIADDDHEYELLKVALSLPDYQEAEIFVWNPDLSICDDVGFIVVRRGYAEHFKPLLKNVK